MIINCKVRLIYLEIIPNPRLVGIMFQMFFCQRKYLMFDKMRISKVKFLHKYLFVQAHISVSFLLKHHLWVIKYQV